MSSYPNPVQSFIQSFMAGQQMAEARRQHQAEEEDRKLRQEHLKLQMGHEKLQSKLAAREHAQNLFKMLEGLPGMTQSQAEPGIDVGGGMEVPGTMSTTTRPQVADFTLPGIEELGVEPTTLHPRTMEQVIAQALQQKRAEAAIKREGDTVQIPPEVQGKGRFPAGVSSMDQALLSVLPETTRVPAGVFPEGHPLAAGGEVDKGVDSILTSVFGQQEQTRREREQGRTARDVANINAGSRLSVANIAKGGGTLSEQAQARVDSTAQRVASGELTVTQANSLLGGVRGGMGQHLVDSLDKLNNRIVPPKVREGLADLAKGRTLVDQIEAQLDKVVHPPEGSNAVQETALLEGLVQSTASILSKKVFLETGRLTEQDVTRARGLVPGWKAANFAPGYARKELNILRELIDKAEGGLMTASFRTVPRGGGGPSSPASTPAAGGGDGEGTIHTYPSGRKVIYKGGQWQPYTGK